MYSKQVEVIGNEHLTSDVFKLILKEDVTPKPGQFYMIGLEGRDIFLKRPISVYDMDPDLGQLSLLCANVGKGTSYMSKLKKGDIVDIVGPLGNGFDIKNISGKVALVSGGIGIAPFMNLVKNIEQVSFDLYSGFRSDTYCTNEFEQYVDNIYISTDDGSTGHKGFVTDLVDPCKYDLVITCGPEIMMKKVIAMCKKDNIPSLASLENRMACGIGACLVCSCKTVEGMKRTCMDGPVFKGEELIF